MITEEGDRAAIQKTKSTMVYKNNTADTYRTKWDV